ncbi:MAG: copper resistance CopC/CopD family protein [Micromonosporaceae bacterium]
MPEGPGGAARRWRWPRARALLGVALAAVVAGLLWSHPAAAHATLLKTSPAQGAVVDSAPRQVTLVFSETVQPLAGHAKIIGPRGTRFDAGQPRADGDQLVIKMRDGAPRGTYLVSFRVVSADGHPVSGGFSFSVGEPSKNSPKSSESDDSLVVGLLLVLRYLGHAGLALLVGSAGALAIAWPARRSRRGAARLAWFGYGAVAISALGELVLQVPYRLGTGIDEVRGSDLLTVFDTWHGQAHLARIGLLALAAPSLRHVIAGGRSAVHAWLLAGVAAAALITWPLSGHPVGSPLPWLSVAVDVAHLGAVSVWLGGLAVLAGFLLSRRQDGVTRRGLRVWSRVAAVTVIVLVLGGVAQALIEVPSLDALTSTRYGLLILIKAALLVVILGAAALARRSLLARLAGPEPARRDPPESDVESDSDPPAAAPPAALRSLVAVEVALVAVVLAVTAVLAQTTPARTAAAAAEAQSVGRHTTELESPLFTVRVEVTPARVGENEVHLYATDKKGKPLKVREWQVTAALPAKDLSRVEAPMLALSGDHATGQIGLPARGRWVFSFTLRTSEIDQATVRSTVPIR